MEMQEPYMARPAIGTSYDATGGEPSILNVVAVAAPAITSIIIGKIVDSMVNIVIPIDPKKDRDNFYKNSHTLIKKSRLPTNTEINSGVVQVIPEPRKSDSKEWISHVERAKEELAAAEKKVRCGKCKKDISEVKKDLESRTGEMVGNAKRHLAMIELQKQGKITSGKTWNELSAKEKKLVKSSGVN